MYRIIATKNGKIIESGDMAKRHAMLFAVAMVRAYDSITVINTGVNDDDLHDNNETRQ